MWKLARISLPWEWWSTNFIFGCTAQYTCFGRGKSQRLHHSVLGVTVGCYNQRASLQLLCGKIPQKKDMVSSGSGTSPKCIYYESLYNQESAELGYR
ncbi:hypothetical protein EDB19DRAFT_1113366 [Suillus lakei]|nr:hypothetical protein EDB19DRAFT_1113366 [Suillus lakei]